MSTAPEDTPPFARLDPVPRARWRAAVEAGLKGQPFEKTYDKPVAPGVTGPVLSTLDDARDPGLPGVAPYLRGTRATPAAWGTAVPVFHGAPGSAALLVDDAARGASAAFLLPAGPPLQDPAAVLAGVPVGLALYLVPGLLAPEAVPLAVVEAGRPLLSPGLDPVCSAALAGTSARAPGPWQAAEAALRAAEASGSAALRPLCVDTGYAHGAGADDVLDLALLVSAGVAQLRRLSPGRGLRGVTARQVFHVNLGTHFFQGIAKLRALRALWSRVCEASGEPEAAAELHVVAGLGARHLTVRDPHVNMLRNTAACFAGALGGADVLLSQPFDLFVSLGASVDGETRAMARRVARNTPLMLALESGLDRVKDPVGGSWTVERLTADLAAAAWARFQQLEAQGGVEAALEDDWLAGEVRDCWAALSRDVDRRKRPLTGVSEFPLLDEPLSAPCPPFPQDGPFPLRRLAAGFEALRDRADAHLARTGRRPRVFLANLGPVAAHTARATWITNVLAAGGIEALGNDGFEEVEALAAAFEESGATHACLCGSDAGYAELAADAARALEDAGAEGLLLAGRPGAHEDAWREAGVGRFVYLGLDIRGLLSELLDELIAADPPPGEAEGAAAEEAPTSTGGAA